MPTTALGLASPLLDLVFDDDLAGRCLVAPDGTILRVNAEWLRSTGFAAEDVLGADIIGLFPAARDMALALHARARAGLRVEVPRHLQRIDGRETWWEGTIAPVPMDGGTGLLIVAHQVGPAAAAAAGEGPSRGLLATVVEHSRTCIAVVTGPALRFTLVNPAYQAIAPRTPMLGRTYDEIFPEASASGSRARFLHVLETGEAWEVERWHAPVPGKPDATWRGLVTRLPAIPFEAPSALVVIEDITAQQRAEDALRISEERLALSLEASQVGTWEYDPRSQRAEWSPVSRALLGVPGDGPIPYARFLEAIVPEDRSAVDEAVTRALDPRGDGRYAAQYRTRWPDGSIHWISALGRVHFEAEGDGARRPRRMLGTVMDVTREKQAELALQEADRRKTHFLAVLSHELRNPLAPIRNSLALLDHAPAGSPAAQRAREVLHRQTQQLSRLVDDLLDVSRITHDKIVLQLERLDARELVRRAYADVRALFEQRVVELHLSEPADPVYVEGDAARLAQMVGNLLHNALKFTAPGGDVQLRVVRRRDRCELSVRDTGQGLDPADVERIFDPFVQTGGTERELGLGLGLALVKDLAAKHGGSVRAASEGLGKGAEFVVELPVAPPPTRAAPPASTPERTADLEVLIVEDNEDAATTLADLLSLTGSRAAAVHTGRAGVEAALARRPDVVICDVGLPDISGHEVIRAIRTAEREPRVFAVALTGYAQPQDRADALAAGFDAHLPKPPPIEQLEALLASAARRRGGGPARPGEPAPTSP